MNASVRVELPANLCLLAKAPHEVQVSIAGAVTQRTILDALETDYPMLQGTIREHSSKLRRPFIRFFACEQDLSHMSPDDPLPEVVARGSEPFLIIGAIAGGR
jgi:molybdopterin synthase sulfur carrier subunit